MKNVKKALSVLIFALLVCCGLFFGCGDKYANLKITTDLQDGTITLYMGEDTETEKLSVGKFVATVSGAGDNISTNIKYSFSKDNKVLVEAEQEDEKTTFTLTAINTGSTTMTLITEEGGKKASVNINVVKKLSEIKVNSTYKPYVLAGGESVISTTNALTFVEADTTQKSVEYSIVGSYAGVSVEPNGRIVATEEAKSGSFDVVATSVDNPQIVSDKITVRVFKPITSGDVSFEVNGEDEELVLATDLVKEETLKILSVLVNTEEDYEVKVEYLSGTNNLVSIEKVDTNTFNITGVNAGSGKLQVTITLISDKYVYSGTELKIEKDVTVKVYPTKVTLDGIDTTETVNVFDTYQNQLGMPIKVVVGTEESFDKRFVVEIPKSSEQKVVVVTETNQPISTYTENGDYDIFSNRTTLYVRVMDGYTIDALDPSASINIIAYGSLNLLSEPASVCLNMELKKGVTNLVVENELYENKLMVATGSKVNLQISIPSNEYTSFITANYADSLINYQKTSKIEDAYIKNNKIMFDFVVEGVKEGVSSIEFITENGQSINVDIRVFVEINAYQITSQSINENSSIGELQYDAVVTTYDGAETSRQSLSEMAIAINGEVKLSINPIYYDGSRAYFVSGNFVETTLKDENEILTILSNGTVIARTLGTTTIKVQISVYTNSGKIDLPEQNIDVVVYTDIKSMSFNSNYVELLTYDDLGANDKDKSTFTFDINVFPESAKATVKFSDISWSISGQNKGDITLVDGVVTAKKLTPGMETGSATITAIYTQYGRTFVLEATIKIDKAVRVEDIYNLAYVKNGVSTSITKRDVLGDDDTTKQTDVYYIYFDSRDGIGANSQFQITQSINPSNAYNSQIAYSAENANKNDTLSVLSITDTGLVTVNRAGTAYIYVSAVDSATSDGTYAITKKIYVKIADGLSSATSLEISNASDFVAINNNKESLSKFYQLTADINLSSIMQSGWTPIGVQDGEVYQFNGNINGKISSLGETKICTISGIRISGTNSSKNAIFGLFAELSTSAVIKNLEISVEELNATYTANDSSSSLTFGVLCATNNGVIQNVSVNFANSQSLITECSNATNIGGIVGINNGKVTNSYVSGNLKTIKQNSLISSTTNIGGIVGTNNNTINGGSNLVNNANFDSDYSSTISIVSCYINPDSNEETFYGISGEIYVGGVAGTNNKELTYSSFDGSITAINNVGGIVGLNVGSLGNCFASGIVNGYQNVGGIAGSSQGKDATASIEFCAVNMFDDNDYDYAGEITPNITVKFDNAGGLVGSAENTSISNSFVKTYYVRVSENYVGDIVILKDSNTQYVGGLVGSAKNVDIEKCYADVKISCGSNSSAVVGGLVGKSESVTVANSYTMGSITDIDSQSQNIHTGKIFGEVKSSVSLTTSYSTISDKNIISTSTSMFAGIDTNSQLAITNSYHLSTGTDDIDETALYNDTNNGYIKTEAELKTMSTYSGWKISNTTTDGNDWYINENQNNGYPMLVASGKTLGVEAPTDIEVTINEKSSNITKINDTTLILWKTSSQNSVAITGTNGVFSAISILPSTAGSAYTIKSSDNTVFKVTGRNSNRLTPVANGYATLTITSRLNNSVSTTITIYVQNKIEGFGVTVDNNLTSLVNEKQMIAVRYNNASNYKFEITTTETSKTKSQYIFINNQSLSGTVTLDLTSKLYIYSTVSMQDIGITITPYIEVADQKIYFTSKTFTYSSYYGLKDFSVSAMSAEITDNDYVTLTYTATGDDLRIETNNNGEYSLPTLKILLNGNEILFDVDDNELNSNSVLSITQTNKSELDGIDLDNAVSKIVYQYLIKVNKDKFTESSATFNITAKFSLKENDYTNSQLSGETATTITVSKQPLKKIDVDFFADSQKTTDADGNEVYTINEAPSQKIVTGQIGMLRISLYPETADIKEVKIYADSSTSYSISMMQVVRYVYEKSDSEAVAYLERKPYATGINNGKGLQLYLESNYITSDTDNVYTFDGNLYVNFIIPSNVPEGTTFSLTVEALLSNGTTIFKTFELYSDISSQIELSYTFANQVLTDVIYVAKDVEQTIRAKFTKLDVEQQNGGGIKNLTITSECNLNFDSLSGGVATYKFTPTENGEFTIYFTMTKVVNGQLTTIKSNTLKVYVVDYVVESIDISNTNGDVLNLPTNTEATLKVKITAQRYEYEAQEGETANSELQAKSDDIDSAIKALEESISKNLKSWFAKDSSGNYASLDTKAYTNFTIIQNKIDDNTNDYITIRPKKASSGDVIYAVVKLKYSTSPSQDDTDTNITVGSSVGIQKSAQGEYFQVLSTSITTRFYYDTSATSSIPVGDLEDTGSKQELNQLGEVLFTEIANGSESSGTMYYRLKENITLSNYTPIDLSYVRFDGNGYTITINGFSEEALSTGNLGLFGSIDEFSIVENLTVEVELSSLDLSNSSIEELNFGGITAQNYGVIYNCKASGSVGISTLASVDSGIEVYVGGICGQNDGYISFSESDMTISVNRGYVGGFVAFNNGTVSNSKVILSGISNTSTTELLTQTGGFVARNYGKIYGSYVKGSTNYTDTDNKLRYKEVVFSYTTVGGFVNENGGTISNCYSNITVTSYTRSSGFVYNNKGTVQSCYSASKMETHNSAHNAFTGISTSGLNNTGTISDCYYLKDEFGSTSKEPATKLTTIEKSQFANFVFNEDSSNSLSGTWEITDGSLPELIDANLTLESKQQYNGIENNAYNWTFENIDLSYGKSSGGKYNLRTVASFDDLNTVVNGNTTSDYIVLCKDIECDEYTTPSSANYEFSGTFIGSNMTISNLYLKASNSSQKPYFGLFGKLAGGTVKDINIKAMQCVANNTSYVGVLAGAIDSSSVTNITINASNVVVQGKYFVGGLAGYVNNSNVTKIDVSTSVNASYRGTESYATVFGELNDNNTYDYTYSGIVTGILTGTSNMKLVNVSGECKSIGYFASACVGLVDTDSTLTLASVTVQTDQYIRGFYVSGGLVAENRGTIDRCSIAHSNSVQALIDSNNSTTNRNLTLFAGSTKVLGGLVGFNNGGNILYSYSKIDVRAETISTYVAGGLVGTMTNGSISNCYATGSVVCNKIIGGLVGSITTHNSICNVQESSTSNTSAIFADDKNLAGKISDGTVSIKNSIASNRWLSSDTEIISLAYQKGLLVGCVNPSDNSGNSTDSDTNSNSTYSDTSVDSVDSNIPIEEIDSRITIENCYVNTQLTQNTLTSTDDQIVGYANKNAILKAFMGEDVEIKNLAEIQNYSLGGVTANFDGTQSESNSEKHRIAEIESSDTLITFYYINNYDSNMFSMLNKNNDGTYDVADSFFEIPSKTSSTSIYPTIKSNINKQIEVSTTKDSGTN